MEKARGFCDKDRADFLQGEEKGRERDIEGLNVFMSFARQDTVSRLQAR